MKDFIEKIVLSILESDNFKIIEEKQENLLIYTILVSEEEIGKIIGKDGKVINSIRTLCRVKATKIQEKILLKVDKLP